MLGKILGLFPASIVTPDDDDDVDGDTGSLAFTPPVASATLRHWLTTFAKFLLETRLLLRKLGGRRKDLGDDITPAWPAG